MTKKTVQAIAILLLAVLPAGCATVPPPLDPNYSMYVASIKPLMDLKLTPDGKVAQITMNQPPQPYIRQPNEWARVVEKLIGAAGVFGAIWAGGQALEGIVDSIGKNAGTHVSGSAGAFVGNTGAGSTYASPPTTYTNSFNPGVPAVTPAPATAGKMPSYLIAEPVPVQ